MKNFTKTFLGSTIEIIEVSANEVKAIIKKGNKTFNTLYNKDPQLLCTIAMSWVEHNEKTHRVV